MIDGFEVIYIYDKMQREQVIREIRDSGRTQGLTRSDEVVTVTT